MARLWAETGLVTSVLGVTALGYLALAERLVGVFSDLSAAAIVPVSQVLFAKIRDSADRLRTWYRTASSLTYAAVAPFMSMLLVGAPVIVPLLYGEGWEESIVLVQVLSVAAVLVIGAVLDHGLFYGVGRPGEWFSYAVVVDALTVTVTAVAVRPGLLTVAIGFLLVAALATSVRTVLVARLIDCTPWFLVRPVLPILAAAGLASAIGAMVIAGTADLPRDPATCAARHGLHGYLCRRDASSLPPDARSRPRSPPPACGSTHWSVDSDEAGGGGMTRPRKQSLPTNVGPCVLWFAETPWDGLAGTDKMLVEAADRPVVWVDAPSPPHRPGGRWLPAPLGGVELVRVAPLLVRVTPFVFPMSSRRPMRHPSATVVVAQVRAALRRLGATPASVVAHPSLYLGRWGKDVLRALYGTDDYEAGSELMGISPAWLRQLTARSIMDADVSIAVTPALADKWRQMGADPVVLPNGCQVPEMASHSTSPSPSPKDGPPTVGLVGHLSARIDIGILEAIAEVGFTLLIAGPYDDRWEPARFRHLVERANVEYIGVIPSWQIPALLGQVDVGITPFLDSEFNRASFPLKTLEYLGAGLPVVSTDLPASRWIAQDMNGQMHGDAIRNHLAIASRQEDFVLQVGRLAGIRAPSVQAERRRYAAQHSWQSRWSTLMSMVEASRNTQQFHQ